MIKHIMLLLLIAAAPQFAQTWNKVQALKPGEEVRVQTAQGKQIGVLIQTDDGALRFRPRDGAEISVPKEQVQRVWVRSKSKRLRNTLIGAGVGVAVGAVLYGTLGALFRNEGHESDGMFVVPILAGTAVGGLLPTGGMKLVYHAAP